MELSDRWQSREATRVKSEKHGRKRNGCSQEIRYEKSVEQKIFEKFYDGNLEKNLCALQSRAGMVQVIAPRMGKTKSEI